MFCVPNCRVTLTRVQKDVYSKDEVCFCVPNCRVTLTRVQKDVYSKDEVCFCVPNCRVTLTRVQKDQIGNCVPFGTMSIFSGLDED
jgi:hypothetical protein